MAKKSITKNYMYNLVYQIVILILPFITTPYVSRVLGAEAIGIYSYTYSIVTYFALFGSLGVSLYGQREIAYANENKEVRKKVFIEIILFRFITMAISILIFACFFMKNNQYSTYYRILIIVLFANCFDISWLFQGMEEFKKTVTRNVCVRIVSVSLVFIFVKTRDDLIKYTYIYSLADFIGNLSLWLYLPKYMKGVKIKNVDIFRHMMPIILLFIPQIANQVYNMLDKTMIGKMIENKAEVGYYEQGQKLIRILLTIVTSLGTVMVPRMAATFASGDKEKVNEYMKMSFRFVFFLSFPITFGTLSVSKQFVPIFLGEGYDKVALLINIISPIILLMGIANVIGTQYLLPTKRQKEYTSSIVVGLIVNFILNAILISKYEAIGASIATVISQLVVDIMQMINIKNEIDLKQIFKLSYKYFISAVVMFVVCQVIKLIHMNNIASIVAQVVAGAITYCICLVILKDDYIYIVTNKLKERFKGKKAEIK